MICDFDLNKYAVIILNTLITAVHFFTYVSVRDWNTVLEVTAVCG